MNSSMWLCIYRTIISIYNSNGYIKKLLIYGETPKKPHFKQSDWSIQLVITDIIYNYNYIIITVCVCVHKLFVVLIMLIILVITSLLYNSNSENRKHIF